MESARVLAASCAGKPQMTAVCDLTAQLTKEQLTFCPGCGMLGNGSSEGRLFCEKQWPDKMAH